MTHLNEMISKYFSYAEALWLPQWERMATEADGLNEEIESNLKELFTKMDTVREYFNCPLVVHCCYRPEEYNKKVKGATQSAHLVGKAIDFHVKNLSCKNAISKILADDMLEKWGMRMENNGPDPAWIHLDLKPVGPGGRYFKP